MRKLLTFVLAMAVLFVVSVGLMAKEDSVVFLPSCRSSNIRVAEIALPRGEYYTNIANRIQFMYVIQKDIINLSRRNACYDQYLLPKYEQIYVSFTNLTSAVRELESLLRETRNDMMMQIGACPRLSRE